MGKKIINKRMDDGRVFVNKDFMVMATWGINQAQVPLSLRERPIVSFQL